MQEWKRYLIKVFWRIIIMLEKLLVDGMSCQHCKQSIEGALQKLNGVNKVVAYHEEGFVDIDYDEKIIDIEMIVEEIEDLGFDVKTS